MQGNLYKFGYFSYEENKLPIPSKLFKTGVELLGDMINVQVDTRGMNDVVDNVDYVRHNEEEPSKKEHHCYVICFQIMIHTIDINQVHGEPRIHVQVCCNSQAKTFRKLLYYNFDTGG